ncbi:acetyl-CoA carboxylase biotin carboxylase subunit [Tsukamurella tyrosinosolvens]|uniref:acetyl-CoA carboxylase biotin carboxylase subunit n=1 Tax=Tsukamurella tyrosinosolvens TaxID=57704 RepID=UPI001AF8A22A|nr:acetyl-CoA carboxylase biotin carboxylase subunit [Tsukamurella tyrosinosolvens]QRY86075.1 acetyl-CoA carboxylase biotin carboxylase subunit [Tsukamurella tyrosinosolvens]
MPEIKRLLVANRGEIAVRVIRAAQEMGIVAIAAYSDADASSLAVRIADEAVNIGGAHAKKSYLNAAALLEAAKSTGADAVHPGYGFLSENAEFAQAVTDAGLVWIGPDAGTIERMGHKAQAIATARAAGVPVVPGSDGLLTSADEAVAVARRIGYPVLLKAAAGGGGRGIRIAGTDEEVVGAFADARQEAEAAFGDGGIYLEKFIARARHIEVQVLGDGADAVHFFERDCSLQRRRQKVWEEAPAAVLDEDVRAALCESAVALTRSVGYVGAGTIEYLYDPDTREYYFIEMNTRIQVEHPLTEEICGVDLIRAMIEVCQGDPLPYRQATIARRGHAIEVRINAEDPAQEFRPAPGTVETVSWAQGPGVRVDSMAYSGYRIPPFYDSLIGKLIVWAETRELALARLERALRETEIAAPATTLPFFEELLAENDVRRNALHTNWIEQRTENQ